VSSSTIKIKRSTGLAAPTSLAFGELAYSSGSGKLYFGSSTNGTSVEIVEAGGAYYTGLLSNVTAGTAAASKAVIIDASKNVSGLGAVGLSSAIFSGSTSGTATLIAPVAAGTTSFTLPSTSGTLIGNGDTGTVTNTMLAYKSITINGKSVDLGSSVTLNTDDISQEVGATNKWFSNALAQAAVSAANSGTGYGAISYSSSTGIFTFTKVTDADIRGAFTEGTGVTITDGAIAIGQSVATDADVTFNSVSITGAPSSSTHAVTKGYVDALTTGLSWKNAVRVATTAAITVVADLKAGDTVDGVTLASGDRVLVKNQPTASQNGIYIVSLTGAVRAEDMSDPAEFDGAAVYVKEGSTWQSTGWTQTATISSVGTDSVTWVQFSGAGTYVWGAGLSDTGNTINVLVDDSTIEVNGSDALQVKDAAITSAKLATGAVDLTTDKVTGTLPVSKGGTGASTLTAGSILLGNGTDPVSTVDGLAWNGTTDTLTVGGATIATAANGDVTISTIGENSDLKLLPNGTGSVVIQTDNVVFDAPNSSSSQIESGPGDTLSIIGTAGLTLQSGAGDIVVTLAAPEGSETTNKMSIAGPVAADYATGLANNDLTNKYYVDQTITAAVSDIDGGEY
jgi:hypothetical protein